MENIETNLLLGGAIVGVVNAVTMQFPQVKGIWALLLAVALGLGAGYIHLFGVSMEMGLITALASSGVYKVATKMGGN